jgi:hypothetical protein
LDLNVPKGGHCGELVFDYLAEEQPIAHPELRRVN